MKTNFNFIASLFNKAEQTADNVNNLPTKAYKVRINGNIALIESVWISKMGGKYGTKDVRTVSLSIDQIDPLKGMGIDFLVCED